MSLNITTRGRGRGRRSKQRQQNIFVMPQKPPKNMFKLKIIHTFRYECTSTGNSIISLKDLFAMLVVGNITAAGTSCNSAMSAYKLRNIKIWGTGGSTSGPTTISLEPVATLATSLGTEPIQLNDTAYAPNKFPTICYIPNKNTAHGMWQIVTNSTTTTGDQYFLSLQTTSGDIMDITLKFYLNSGDTALNFPTTQAPAGGLIRNLNIPLNTPAWQIVD